MKIHVLISGAGRRIGLFLVERYLENHAAVTVLCRNKSDSLEKLLQKYPKTLEVLSADLQDLESLKKAPEIAASRFGKIDVLINNASQFFPTPLGHVSPEQWDTLFDTNLKGHFFLTQASLPFLSPSAVIINIGDIHGEKPMSRHSPYTAAKAGLLMLTRNLALELAPEIRVNAISPGYILMPEGTSKEEADHYTEKTLFGRLGSPSDIWEALQFLVGNSYLTGQVLKVDGGASL